MEFPTVIIIPPSLHEFNCFRTSGNSIRTDLIGKNANWLLDYAWWEPENVPYNPKLIGHSMDSIYDQQWSNSSIQVIKGWFSWRQVTEYHGPGSEFKKVITILRYPTERIYSLYKRLTTYGLQNIDPRDQKLFQVFGRLTIDGKSVPLLKSLTLNEFLNVDNCRLQSMITNYATSQIADSVDTEHCGLQRNDSVMEGAYERAKVHLRTFDFIGFYEDMWNDFELLHQKIFPDVEGTFLLRTVFNIGTLVALPRMKVLKYSSQMDQVDLELIERNNKYDLMLYEYAKKLTNKTFKLYNSYSEYALGW